MLSTNSWMGGKNLFLGVAYLVVGGLSFLTALSFLIAHYTGCFGALRRRKCAPRFVEMMCISACRWARAGHRIRSSY